jgi:HEAT repeat protein
MNALTDTHSAVRYWAVSGIPMRCADAVKSAAPALRTALSDSGPSVRASAADALVRPGSPDDASKALAVLADLATADENVAYVSLWALITIDDLGDKAKPTVAQVKKCSVKDAPAAKQSQGYPAHVMEKLQGQS